MKQKKLPLAIALGVAALFVYKMQLPENGRSEISSVPTGAGDFLNIDPEKPGILGSEKFSATPNPHGYSPELLAVAERLTADTIELRRLPWMTSLDEEITLELGVPGSQAQLKKRSYRSKNFQVVLESEDGSFSKVESGPVRTYIGRVSDRQDATITAHIGADGIRGRIADLVQGGISIDPLTDEEARVLGDTVPGSGRLHAFHVPRALSLAETGLDFDYMDEDGNLVSALGEDGVVGAGTNGNPAPRILENVCVREAELGIDVTNRFYRERGSSSVDTTKALMESWMVNEIAVFERDALIRHVLGTLIIRTNQSTDPYVDSGSSSPTLERTRSIWNTSGFPQNLADAAIFQNGGSQPASSPAVSRHDLAITVMQRSIGVTGLAYVGQVGRGSRYGIVTARQGLGFWRNGGQHELGHIWSLRHGDGCNQEPWINGNTSTGVICGSSQVRANSVEVDRIQAHADSRPDGVLPDTEPSGPYPPYCRIDRLVATIGQDNMLDVLGNDHDVNNDNFFIGELRVGNNRVSQSTPTELLTPSGGTIIRSIGTGPNGRDQVTYTPPLDPIPGTSDGFFYLVEDLTGQRNWGFVEVTPSDGTLFEEHFNYVAGDLSGNENAGDSWDGEGGMVGTNELAISSFPDFEFRGRSVVIQGSSRQNISVPGIPSFAGEGSTLYVSFVQKLNTNDSGEPTRIVEFWNGGAFEDRRSFSFGTFTSSVPNSPRYGIFVQSGDQNIPGEVGSITDDARLVVLKIEYGANGNDEISAFMDPGETEPTTATTSVSAQDLTFNRIGFGSFQGGSQVIDEIRIGSTYEAVAPVGFPDAAFLVEDFDHSAGSLIGRPVPGIGAWEGVTGDGEENEVTSGSLEPAVPAGLIRVGGKFEQMAKGRVRLELPGGLAGGEDLTTLYVGFSQQLRNIQGTPTQLVEFYNGPINGEGDARAFAFGTFVGSLLGAPDYGLFIEAEDQEVAYDAGDADLEPHFIVMKIDYGVDDADSISLYYDPATGEEPFVPTSVLSANDLSFVQLAVACFQDGSQIIDNLRIGPSYRSVVPTEMIIDPDMDGDGLPDAFEERHYGGRVNTDGTDDLDKDGQNDSAEFIAGTDPTDNSSLFGFATNGIEIISSTEVILSWFSVIDKEYTVWSTSSFEEDSWEQIAGPITASGPFTDATVPLSDSRKFYQIRVSD